MNTWAAPMCCDRSSSPATALKRSRMRTSGTARSARARSRVAASVSDQAREPALDDAAGPGVERVEDDVREDGELVAPPLDVVVAHGGVGEGMVQVDARAAGDRLQADADP